VSKAIRQKGRIAAELTVLMLGRFLGGFTPPPNRPWASHEEGQNSEKIDTVDTVAMSWLGQFIPGTFWFTGVLIRSPFYSPVA